MSLIGTVSDDIRWSMSRDGYRPRKPASKKPNKTKGLTAEEFSLQRLASYIIAPFRSSLNDYLDTTRMMVLLVNGEAACSLNVSKNAETFGTDNEQLVIEKRSGDRASQLTENTLRNLLISIVNIWSKHCQAGSANIADLRRIIDRTRAPEQGEPWPASAVKHGLSKTTLSAFPSLGDIAGETGELRRGAVPASLAILMGTVCASCLDKVRPSREERVLIDNCKRFVERHREEDPLVREFLISLQSGYVVRDDTGKPVFYGEAAHMKSVGERFLKLCLESVKRGEKKRFLKPIVDWLYANPWADLPEELRKAIVPVASQRSPDYDLASAIFDPKVASLRNDQGVTRDESRVAWDNLANKTFTDLLTDFKGRNFMPLLASTKD